jgi:hypothetical protein
VIPAFLSDHGLTSCSDQIGLNILTRAQQVSLVVTTAAWTILPVAALFGQVLNRSKNSRT